MLVSLQTCESSRHFEKLAADPAPRLAQERPNLLVKAWGTLEISIGAGVFAVLFAAGAVLTVRLGRGTGGGSAPYSDRR